MYERERHALQTPNLAFYLLQRRDDPQALLAYQNARLAWERERDQLRLIDAQERGRP